MRQMAQDIELARNNAHMLIEAVSFADPDLEAIEENELIQVSRAFFTSGSGELLDMMMDSNLICWSWLEIGIPLQVSNIAARHPAIPFGNDRVCQPQRAVAE